MPAMLALAVDTGSAHAVMQRVLAGGLGALAGLGLLSLGVVFTLSRTTWRDARDRRR